MLGLDECVFERVGYLLTNTTKRQRADWEVDQAIIGQNTSTGSLWDHTLDELNQEKSTNNTSFRNSLEHDYFTR